MFTVILIDKAVYVVASNGMLVSARSYLTREKSVNSYMSTSNYLDNNNLLSNDSVILN